LDNGVHLNSGNSSHTGVEKEDFLMRIGRTTFVLALITLLILSGCSFLSSSIQSESVRKLIDKEGEKIQTARGMAKKFKAETASRNKTVKKALDDLSRSQANLQTFESIHAFVFSSNQNITTKKGVDAHAVTYLIGKIYLEEHAGLEKRVLDQFEEDFEALVMLADRIDKSWESLHKLHTQIAEYSKKSAVASVDPELLAAITEHVPGSPEKIESILKNSRRVNEALEEALGSGFLRESKLEQLRSITGDLIDLLERVK